MPWLQVNKKRSPGEGAPLPMFAGQRGPLYSGTTWKSKVLTLTHQEAWLNMLLLWERAMQKAKAKLNGQEEEQKPLEKGTSSRGRSSTPKAKPLEKGQRASRSSSKKGKPLEKGKEREKVQGQQGPGPPLPKERARRARARRARARRGRRAKALEKAKSQKRRNSNVRKSWRRKMWKSQRKRPRRRSTRPTTMWGARTRRRNTATTLVVRQNPALKLPKRKPPVKAPPVTPPAEVLEKIPENEVKQNAEQALERKPPVKAPPVTPPAQVLEKIPKNEVKQNAQQALEKAREKLKKTYKDAVVQSPKLPAKKACILKPAYELLHHHRQPVGSWKRPRVIVDWHNTLELHDQVPPTHDKALDALLEKADVYLLSFCGKDRQERALRDMHSVRQSHRFAAIQTCSMRSGRDGKSAWGIFWGVEAIFDDNNEVCDDCSFTTSLPMPSRQKWEPHHGLSHQGMAFDSFPEAVYAYLEKLKGNSSGSGHQ